MESGAASPVLVEVDWLDSARVVGRLDSARIGAEGKLDQNVIIANRTIPMPHEAITAQRIARWR